MEVFFEDLVEELAEAFSKSVLEDSRSSIHGWHTKQINFTQAFPTAPISNPDTYVELPKGVEILHEDRTVVDPNEYVFKVHQIIYCGKDVGRQWYLYLCNILVNKMGFTKSQHDECVFYQGTVMYVLYTDDSILAGPTSLSDIDQVIAEMRGHALDITEEGTVVDFLGVNIDKRDDRTFHLSQPSLIASILEELGLQDDNVSTKDVPMASSKLLGHHAQSKEFDGHFNMRRVIGKLLFLEQSTCGDITMPTHQCSRFVSNPKVEHGEAINGLVDTSKEWQRWD